jgi:hypothetical protein
MDNQTLLGWSPMVVLGVFIGIDLGLEAYSPSLFCSPINPGGKEQVCGFGYSAPLIQTITILAYVLYFGALILAGHQAFRRNLSKFGAVGFGASVLVVLGGLMLRSQFGAEDSP